MKSIFECLISESYTKQEMKERDKELNTLKSAYGDKFNAEAERYARLSYAHRVAAKRLGDKNHKNDSEKIDIMRQFNRHTVKALRASQERNNKIFGR